MSSTIEKVWQEPDSGLFCAVKKVAAPQGFAGTFFTKSEWRCGYVRLPESASTTEIDWEALDVHGGVTFFGPMPEMETPHAWIGFDTNHSFSGEWTLDDTIQECEMLARQAWFTYSYSRNERNARLR